MTAKARPAAPVTHLNVICYKWGTMYTAEEVNILRAMVKRNLSLPHRFFCITDDATGIDESEVEVRAMPPYDLPGNGPKIWTFSDGFLGLGPDEHVVSLDIDLVVVGSLDFLADRPEEDFIIARHRGKATESNREGAEIFRGHGAVYRVRVGSLRQVWDDFIADPFGHSDKFPGLNGNDFSEQRWLAYELKDREPVYFPEEKIIIYRLDCDARAASYKLGRLAGDIGLTTAWFGKARLPGKGEAIVSFAGKVNPRDVRDRHCGHLKQAPFVAEHWRL